MDQELLEFKAWLKTNRKMLEKYASDELANMARMCGFSWSVILRVVPEAYQDLQTHSTYKLREDFHIKKELDFIKEKSGKPKLDEQWHAVYNHQEHGEDWAA